MSPRFGLARVLSKLGVCSRTQATAMILTGRVSVDGKVENDPERRTDATRERIAIDGVDVRPPARAYVALNKPPGVVVSASDERGRDTVYRLLEKSDLPWVAPVGRLDKASEGLLLLSNDSVWAAGITDPASRIDKTYHVQVDGIPDQRSLDAMRAGIYDDGEYLAAAAARLLRAGRKNSWLEIVLDEGRNRQIRRLLGALGYEVSRLVRISIGPIVLRDLPKGRWRRLDADEVRAMEAAKRFEAASDKGRKKR
jgi:23S rRNA pseudouridine2605 synthase